MTDLTLTASSGKSDLTVVVVGHCAQRLPRLVELQAARIAKGEAKTPLHLVTDAGAFLLVKPDDKPWLTGGEPWRLLGRDIVDTARAHKAASVTVHVQGKAANVPALVEGLHLGDYRFTQLRSGKDAKRPTLTVHLPGHDEAVTQGTLVAEAQNLARELADLPPNLLHPQSFAERARKVAKTSGLGITVVSGVAKLRKEGFPGLAQVGQAGSSEPCLVVLRYTPKKPKPGMRIALVGKGMTFDSGGISIKPSDKMWEMKADMAGAAAVLGAMTAIAEQAPSVPVTAYLCIAENMPDALAQRPGDIYLARNGKSIHIDNTDAEGRLILADVLTYAAEQGATHVVDIATLTGACLVALGDRIGGLLGRGDAFLSQVRQSGQDVGEEFWPLPLHGEYRSLLDHPHADINNTGGRNGGTITAALFLSEFIPDTVKWAHLDIAGPAIQTGGWRYYAKGMTGFGTRTLIRLVQKLGDTK
jgi:leucyl aminopeptidase